MLGRRSLRWTFADIALCYHCNCIGESPSGKAAAFGAAIRGFESLLPSQSSLIITARFSSKAAIISVYSILWMERSRMVIELKNSVELDKCLM